MNFITLTKENLEQEHICCAISNNKDIQVASKKAWLNRRLDDGLVFIKGDVRGKCFIEYIPTEKAWSPVDADGYMYIDCLWVSGQFKGKGFSSILLDLCIKDSKTKGKKGLVIASSKKKMPFLADPKYLKHKGFILADTANPSYELMYLPFDKDADVPKFRLQVKQPHIEDKGLTIYYTAQCPFTAKYVPILEVVANENDVSIHVHEITTCGEAKSAPSAVTTFSLFIDGEFVTHELMSEKKFMGIINDYKENRI